MAEAVSASTGAISTTVVLQPEDESTAPMKTLRLTLKKPEEKKKKVAWTPDTVDNEHMNKKKSKCCCIYKKPREFNESSSEDDEDECDDCRGHVEKKHQDKTDTLQKDENGSIPVDSNTNEE